MLAAIFGYLGSLLVSIAKISLAAIIEAAMAAIAQAKIAFAEKLTETLVMAAVTAVMA
jgi:chromatin segregation and condensation protein Rec8/ScpA/Scc1 (kleisin family)